MIICDIHETLQFEEEFYKIGDYRHTFYPLVDVLIKAKDSGGWGFTERLLREYIGEDEHIMRIDLDNINSLRWV